MFSDNDCPLRCGIVDTINNSKHSHMSSPVLQNNLHSEELTNNKITFSDIHAQKQVTELYTKLGEGPKKKNYESLDICPNCR